MNILTLEAEACQRALGVKQQPMDLSHSELNPEHRRTRAKPVLIWFILMFHYELFYGQDNNLISLWDYFP